MIEENNPKDPRYYYIQIVGLKMNKDAKFKSQKVNIKLHLGTKYSDTIFSLGDFNDQQKKKRITEEAHIFKYGGEEFLNVYLQEAVEVQQKDNQNNSKKQIVSGYSRILLPPLLEHPHICHQIKANFIYVKNKIQFTKDLLAEIDFNLYYRLDFRGNIDIIPIAANLERNVAHFGQMRPFVQLSIEGQTWTSLEAEGIHPRWSGHFHTKKQKILARKGHYLIKNLRDNALLNTRTLQERQLFHAENMTTSQEYFDIGSFSLCSAGSFLSIKVYSFPMIGKKPDLVGQAEIRISNAGFFRHPNSLHQNEFTEKDIKLFIKEQQQRVNVGNFTFFIRFIFEQNQITNRGPYIQEMPKPKLQLQATKNTSYH